MRGNSFRLRGAGFEILAEAYATGSPPRYSPERIPFAGSVSRRSPGLAQKMFRSSTAGRYSRRSEERRVGKEWRSGGSRCQERKERQTGQLRELVVEQQRQETRQ